MSTIFDLPTSVFTELSAVGAEADFRSATSRCPSMDDVSNIFSTLPAATRRKRHSLLPRSVRLGQSSSIKSQAGRLASRRTTRSQTLPCGDTCNGAPAWISGHVPFPTGITGAEPCLSAAHGP